ncbi:Ubiquinone biosynthesis O-methyltransferase [Kordia antarctica]|uniref:Ubiquinone biosynthesis O-methyltransferase n=1 Tax=Kordia antarctica TaxID=1218801 RepID=A0A7L4ZUU7_9FLAO|nr:methyltransferase domain-containing protein [Kordia antarctica]QHI39104.1 Ubiquinone biosynthesis O-methyltransferase [Kordia antarctica]
MSLFINTKHRTDEVEIMDDFSINGDILHKTLDTLARINKWLGGNHVTISGLKKMLKGHSKTMPITIIDLGCGGGDILRRIASYGKKEGYTFKLIGIDANKDAVAYASHLSKDYENISFIACDIFSEEFEALKYDLVLSTLFLHHFKEEQILDILSKAKKKAKLGIIVNDLHRHPMAYYLFKLVCLTIKNRMIIEDGLTSILRGFKREELTSFSNKLQVKPQIKWKWAFRYQWIIQNK